MTKLAAWYPLHKDTKDWSGNGKHLTLANPSEPSAIEVYDGVLGKCYGTAVKGKTDHLISPPMGLDGDHAMFCFINVSDLGHDSSANGVVTNHNSDTSTGMGITLKATSASTFKASVNTGTGGSRTWHTYYGSTTLNFNKWYHIGFTWEQSTRTLCIYVNGKVDYKSVGAIGEMSMKASSPVGLFLWSLALVDTRYRPAMKLQDVRIYNDIPSLREINWIAKGCMLHWNFNEQAYGGLIRNVTHWIGHDPYLTINETTSSYVKLTMKGQDRYLAIKPNGQTFQNKRMRISGYAYKNGSPLEVKGLSTYHVGAPLRTDPKTGWFVSEIRGNNAHIIHGREGLDNPKEGDIYEFKNLRVEFLEYNYGTYGSVRDVTGLKHDGLATNDLPLYSKVDSNLGNGCYYFEDDAIYSKEPITAGGSNMLTIACWIKTSSIGKDDYHILASFGGANAELDITATGQIRAGCRVNGQRYDFDTDAGLLDGKWHHTALTYDGNNLKSYVDGELKGTLSAVGELTIGEQYLSLGQFSKPKNKYASNKLYQSDVMVFGTALSPDDIKSLARQRLTVDKKAQVHAVEFVESAGNTRVSGRGQLVSPNLYEHNYKRNILDYSVWNIGSSSASNFSRNGQTYENEIVVGTNPHGVNDVMWQAMQENTSPDSDGGFNTSNFDIDKTKAYRFSCWFNRRVIGNGSFYWGTHGYNANGDAALESFAGSKNSNPYFYSGGTSRRDQWFLVVGYVYPTGTAGELYLDDGIYLKDGTRISSKTQAFRWSTDAVQANARAYLYYSSDVSTVQHFYRPRVDVMDGSEPSLRDLIKCQEHTPLFPFYNANGRYQPQKFGLSKNAFAKEFIEI